LHFFRFLEMATSFLVHSVPAAAVSSFCGHASAGANANAMLIDTHSVLASAHDYPAACHTRSLSEPQSHTTRSRKRRFSEDDADSVYSSAASFFDASMPRYGASSASQDRVPVASAKHRITHFSEEQVEREAAAYLARVGRRSGRANIFQV
jgi:hypothetical protein